MPLTSVKIWQRSARSRAARATAEVSEPPRPRVVISAAWTALPPEASSRPSSAATLMPWNPATMTILPAASSACTRRGSMPAIRALPYWPSVVIPAWGPVRLIAGTPSVWSAIETSVALCCSPVARSTSSSRASGSSVMAAARARSSSVVSPIAETMTTRRDPVARSRAIRRATRLMRPASATDEPPNFMTTSGADHGGILAEGRMGPDSGRLLSTGRPARSGPHVEPIPVRTWLPGLRHVPGSVRSPVRTCPGPGRRPVRSGPQAWTVSRFEGIPADARTTDGTRGAAAGSPSGARQVNRIDPRGRRSGQMSAGRTLVTALPTCARAVDKRRNRRTLPRPAARVALAPGAAEPGYRQSRGHPTRTRLLPAPGQWDPQPSA